jgi:hypothetical protein
MLGLAWSALSPAMEDNPWGVRMIRVATDFVAAMSHYVDTDGVQLTAQLAMEIPVRKPLPKCPETLRIARPELAQNLEPVLPHLRNIFAVDMETSNSFLPYRILPSVRSFDLAAHWRQRRVLIDVGANGFFASAKHLIDLYATLLPFTHCFLFEPHSDGRKKKSGKGSAVAAASTMWIPDAYRQQYNFSVLRNLVEIGTRRYPNDVLTWLERSVTVHDYVVLKFDVDEGKTGPTMEWGFLADLVNSPQVALVDEIFIELHFLFDVSMGNTLGWKHKMHSMWQAFDIMRELRRCGVAIHAWP